MYVGTQMDLVEGSWCQTCLKIYFPVSYVYIQYSIVPGQFLHTRVIQTYH